MIRAFLRRLDPGAAILWAILIAAVISHFWPAPAHAAAHPDKPAQETAPIADKDQPYCVQSTTIQRFLVDKDGWHKIGSGVAVLEPCHN